MAEYARDEINAIGGYYAYGKELINGGTAYMTLMLLSCPLYTRDIGLTGIEVYDLLRDEYDIQIEFGDIGNILAYISIGDRIQDIERLVGALADIKPLYSRNRKAFEVDRRAYISRGTGISAGSILCRQSDSADNASKRSISGEFVMCYPPGIPILAPGEVITKEIIDYIKYAQEKGCSMQGTEELLTLRI